MAGAGGSNLLHERAGGTGRRPAAFFNCFHGGPAMRLDKEKAGKIAKRYEAGAKKTRSRKEQEKLHIRPDVFRMIEATPGLKPASLQKQKRSGASRYA
jgi:hypothetical protein